MIDSNESKERKLYPNITFVIFHFPFDVSKQSPYTLKQVNIKNRFSQDSTAPTNSLSLKKSSLNLNKPFHPAYLLHNIPKYSRHGIEIYQTNSDHRIYFQSSAEDARMQRRINCSLFSNTPRIFVSHICTSNRSAIDYYWINHDWRSVYTRGGEGIRFSSIKVLSLQTTTSCRNEVTRPINENFGSAAAVLCGPVHNWELCRIESLIRATMFPRLLIRI